MTTLPTPKILLTFALALLLAGCAARHDTPVVETVFGDELVEVAFPTKEVDDAIEATRKAEEASNAAVDAVESVNATNVEQTLPDAGNKVREARDAVLKIRDPLTNVKSKSVTAAKDNKRLKAQAKDARARLKKSEAEIGVLKQRNIDLERGQSSAIEKFLAWFGAFMLVGGVAGAVLSPLKKTAAFGALGGLALIFASQIVGTIGVYRKEITFGLLGIASVFTLYWITVYFIDLRRSKREAEAAKREAEAKQKEAEAARTAVKEVVAGIEDANDQTKDLNLTPQVKAVFNEAQSKETQEIVKELKKEIKAEKAGGITDSKLDAKIDAKIDEAAVGVGAAVKESKAVVERAEVVVDKLEDVVADVKADEK